MLRINFYKTVNEGPKERWGDQILRAYIYLDRDNTIKTGPVPHDDPGLKSLYNNILNEDQDAKEKKLKRDNPKKWLLSLPRKYCGVYFHAQIVIE